MCTWRRRAGGSIIADAAPPAAADAGAAVTTAEGCRDVGEKSTTAAMLSRMGSTCFYISLAALRCSKAARAARALSHVAACNPAARKPGRQRLPRHGERAGAGDDQP